MTSLPFFEDRREAGLRLAQQLQHLAGEDPLLLGVSGGGVEVAAVLAEALGAPLDILAMDSSGSTRHRLAATSRMRRTIRDTGFLNAAGNTALNAEAVTQANMVDLEERSLGHRDLPDVFERTVILVDDGLHPDTEVHAALRTLRRAGVAHLVLATPFLTKATADLHDSEVDELVALEIPQEYGAATDFYVDPAPPDLDYVQMLLKRFRPRAVA